jgi:hypothetical protein
MIPPLLKFNQVPHEIAALHDTITFPALDIANSELQTRLAALSKHIREYDEDVRSRPPTSSTNLDDLRRKKAITDASLVFEEIKVYY